MGNGTSSVNAGLFYAAIAIALAVVFFFVFKKITCANDACGNFLANRTSDGDVNIEKYIIVSGILIAIVALALTYSSYLAPDNRISKVDATSGLVVNTSIQGNPLEYPSFPISNDTRYSKARDTFGMYSNRLITETSNGNNFRDVGTATIKNGDKAFWSSTNARSFCKRNKYDSNCSTDAYHNSYTAIGDLSAILSVITTVTVNELSFKAIDGDLICTDLCDLDPNCAMISFVSANSGPNASTCTLFNTLILSKDDSYDYSLTSQSIYYLKNSVQVAPLFTDQVFFHRGNLPVRYWLKDISPTENVESVPIPDYVLLGIKPLYVIVDPDIIVGGVNVLIYMSSFDLTGLDLSTIAESPNFFSMDKTYRLSFSNHLLVPMRYDTTNWLNVYSKIVVV